MERLSRHASLPVQAPEESLATNGLVSRLWRRVLRSALTISAVEASGDKRGFAEGPQSIRTRLQTIGETFIFGYNQALIATDMTQLGRDLQTCELELRGFAFEGAAMALHLLDVLSPARQSRFQGFCLAVGSPHIYMLHVGAGWAMARLPIPLRRQMSSFDPLLKWLAFDGCGFHCAYFNAKKFVDDARVPSRLTGYQRRAFDQGLGRALWFVRSARVDLISADISAFAQNRRSDLWSGVGLAATYAGGVARQTLSELRLGSGTYADHLAQGSVFGAAARVRAGNATFFTSLACDELCQMSVTECAALAEETKGKEPADDDGHAYENWRKRIRQAIARTARTTIKEPA